MPYMSVLFVFTILFFDLQKILHLIFIQWNGTKDDLADDIDEDLATMPMRKLRWLHNHRKASRINGLFTYFFNLCMTKSELLATIVNRHNFIIVHIVLFGIKQNEEITNRLDSMKWLNDSFGTSL